MKQQVPSSIQAAVPQANQSSNRSMRVAPRSYSPMTSQMGSLSCCDECDDCCVEEQSKELKPVTYVGQGNHTADIIRGKHKENESYSKMGQGSGPVNKEVVTTHEGSLFRQCCQGLFCVSLICTFVVGAIYLYVYIRRPVEFGSSTKVIAVPERYNCSDVSLVWKGDKRDWCCDRHGLGCQRQALNPFDCLADQQDWEKLWSGAKKTWCCEHRNRGCDDTAHDCMAEYETWQQDWSSEKQQWCCHHYSLGCPGTNPYDCQEGYANWKEGWSTPKTEWCCKHQKRGCMRTCEAQCVYKGHTATCAQRIRWATSHNKTLMGSPNACRQSLELIRMECEMCNACSLDEVGCSGGSTDSARRGGDLYDCAIRPYAAWSSNQSVWCCHEYGVGCRHTSLDTTSRGHDLVSTTIRNANASGSTLPAGRLLQKPHSA